MLGELADLPTEAKQKADKLADAQLTIIQLRKELRRVEKAPSQIPEGLLSGVPAIIDQATGLLGQAHIVAKDIRNQANADLERAANIEALISRADCQVAEISSIILRVMNLKKKCQLF